MKYSILFLVLGIFCFSACNPDDDNVDPIAENELRYDGDNNVAPALPTGSYELAARFPASLTSEYIGRELREVEFFLGDIPTSTAVGVWGEGTANTPGDIIYDQAVSNLNNPGSWVRHVLTTPVEITGEDLWISINVNHPQEIRSIGCDAGPANANGDFIYDGNTNSWSNFRVYTNGESSINWNIRGILNE